MKLLRSITQRGATIGTAGYFTVLKPNTWFPASRLPRPFRFHPSESSQPPAETTAPNIITLAVERRHPLRQVLILLASAGIGFAMLMWIIRPR
jgi:hypothetical protein